MGNIIKCDFRRTERHKEMDELRENLSKIVEAFEYPQECDLPFSADEAMAMSSRYAQLQNEEREWGQCKYWK